MQRCKLRDVINIKKGEYITKNEANDGIYPVILGGKEPAYYIDRFNHEGKAIVISRSGASAGYVSFWNEPIFITDGFLVEPKEQFSIEYVYYVLKSRQTQLHNLQNGAAIPHITPSLINRVDVDLHDEPDREKVVGMLLNYDKVIDNNSKRIKILEQMAEDLYKEWFVRFRFPGHEDVEFNAGEPKKWKLTKLEEIINIDRGVSYSSEEIDCDEGTDLINLKNIQAFGGFRVDGTKKYSGKYKEQQIVHRGDLVMGVTDMTQDRRTVGAVALIPLIHNASVISADLIKITSKLNNAFLYCMFKYGGVSRYISQFANGANVLHLRPQVVSKVKVYLPTEDIIDRFSEMVQPIIDEIDMLNESNDNLIKQRDLLLPRLMSGKLEVK